MIGVHPGRKRVEDHLVGADQMVGRRFSGWKWSHDTLVVDANEMPLGELRAFQRPSIRQHHKSVVPPFSRHLHLLVHVVAEVGDDEVLAVRGVLAHVER